MADTDTHEWASFEVDDITYVFDITFLTSNWTCIWGKGCKGVHEEDATELDQGCCSHGAHFTDKADRKRTQKFIDRLTDDQWQFKAEAEEAGKIILKNEDGDWVSLIHDGACILHNRPGFAGGSGCALHGAALAAGERPLDWKPEVCWQLPLRIDHHLDDYEHETYTLREWKRRDWGEGGNDFHWWCTDAPDAFVGREAVFETLHDEIVEMVGEAPYAALVDFIRARDRQVPVEHPAVRRRTDTRRTA